MKQLFKYVIVLTAILIVIATSFINIISLFLVRRENSKNK